MIDIDSQEPEATQESPASSGQSHRTAARLANLGLAVLAFALALVTRADADLWGHLRFGLDILDSRQLPQVDPYSFTQDVPWVNHEWLSEAQMALAYRYGGLAGLLMLKAAILWSVFALIWTALRRATLGVRLSVAISLILGTLHMTAVARPQLWTFLCLVSLCRLLLSPSERWRWLLPLLFVYWVNCHGGWIVGFGVLGVWAAGDGWTQPSTLPRWAALILACFLATLVNPYGLEMWGFIAGTVRMNRAIDEWQPLWTTPVLNWLPWALAVVGTVWMWFRRPPDRLPIAAVLLMLAYASARVLRIESLFVAAAGVLLAPSLVARWPRAEVPRVPVTTALALSAALLAVSVLGSAWVGAWAVACVPIRAQWAPDVEAMASLRHAAPGRIVTPFNWGEYAIWHLGPRVRVSMDGRRETVYSEAMLAANDAVFRGTPEGFEILAQWNPEYVWLPASSQSTIEWLEAHGYRLDIETSRSTVAVRADQPPLPLGVTISPEDRHCFPG